jgi:anaerobic magnesium-protoporphyrin IX monomethyl ester cyclase
MKLLLLNLPHDLDDPDNCDSLVQPYGIVVLSSFMKSKGWDTTLYDAHAHGKNGDEIIEYIVDLNPDFIGLTVYTCHLPQIISFLKTVKKQLPNISTVLGGPHPSTNEYKSLLEQNPCVDYCILGEGELTLHELLKNRQKGNSLDSVKGLAYREGSEVKYAGNRPFIHNLDELPFGDWESLPMDNYWAVACEKKNLVNVLFSRGCVGRCSFCAARVTLGGVTRSRSPESIIKEIAHLYENHHARELAINDATFNTDNEWAAEVSRKIIEYGKKDLVWTCNLRADNMDLETLKLMKDSGLTSVFIGVESGDDAILASIKKGTTVAMIRTALAMLDEVDIKVYCGFILGLPGETPESIERTLKFSKELKKYSVAFSIATPFPGTALYRKAQDEGFQVEDWAHFDYHGIPYVTKGLTREQLSSYYNKIVLRYYLSTPFLVRQIKQLRSWMQFKKTLRLGLRILFGRRKKLKEIQKSAKILSGS